MSAIASALALWLGGGLGALLARRSPFATTLGAGGAVMGSAAALVAGVRALDGPSPESWSVPWSLPGGALQLRLDPLGAVFLLPIGLIGGLCSVYGVAYLRRHGAGRSIAGALAEYNLLLASMAVVVVANDLLLLVIAWEVMTLSSWALVVSDHRDTEVRAAGLQYLVAGHLATAALLLLALFLSLDRGTFEIAALGEPRSLPGGLLFVLVLLGFGTKAGIVPMHVWLPDAHPAAPSHVSALMSAVMITMGFYGIARFLSVLGDPATWWAYLLLLLGAVGAVGGVLFALAQRDVKRVLAYSTVENAGIATLALGLGVLGSALDRPDLAGLGWTAALLHLWNHALAKGALFLGFGAVAQAVGSRDLDRWGGLLARWPLIGSPLVLAAAAIASLPGLNVFTSEWLLLRGLLLGGMTAAGLPQSALLAVVVALALAGGLAVACFTRLVGIGLLGSPRSAGAAAAHPPGWMMWGPVLVLAAACVLVASMPAVVAGALAAAVGVAAPGADVVIARTTLRPLVILLPLVTVATLVVLAARALAVRRWAPELRATWACGYAEPTATMQYSSTSFGQPLTSVLEPVLRTETRAEVLPGPAAGLTWPRHMRRTSRTADRVLAAVYQPLFAAVARTGARLRAHYTPRVTTSLFYMVATVLAVLALLFLPGGRG